MASYWQAPLQLYKIWDVAGLDIVQPPSAQPPRRGVGGTRALAHSIFLGSMGSVVFPAVCQVCLSSRLCFSDFWLDKHLVAAAIPPPCFIAQQRNARPKQRRKPLCQVVDSLLGTCAAGSEHWMKPEMHARSWLPSWDEVLLICSSDIAHAKLRSHKLNSRRSTQGKTTKHVYT